MAVLQAQHTLTGLLARRVRLGPDAIACRYWQGGRWREVSWLELQQQSRLLAKRLVAWGVERLERVAILAATRFEWLLCDLAVAAAGAVSVALPTDLPPAALREALAEQHVRVAFVEGPAQLAQLVDERGALRAGLRRVVYFDARSQVPGRPAPLMLDEVTGWPPSDELSSLEELIESPVEEAGWGSLEGRAREPGELASIAFTAGTTGPHRAIALSERNLAWAGTALGEGLEMGGRDLVLVALPLCNAQGRVFALAALAVGATLAIGQGLSRLIDDAGHLQPTFVVSSPTVFERLSSRILSDAQASSPLRRVLFGWAMETGREASLAAQHQQKGGRLLGLRRNLAERLVFSKLHALFGGRLRAFVSAGSALSSEASEFFAAAGVMVLEGYGLTECAGLTHLNRPDAQRFGTVGLPLPGVETRIDDATGCIELRCDGIGTARHLVRTDDGWLRTDDLGHLEGGFLVIDARQSEILTLSSGERVDPTLAEHRLRAEPMISRAVAYGEGRPYLTALITLNEESLRRWAREQGLEPVDPEGGQRLRPESITLSELTQSQSAYQYVDALVRLHNSELSPAQQIRKFAVLESDLSVEQGELTALLEVRREVVYEHFASILESFYSETF